MAASAGRLNALQCHTACKRDRASADRTDACTCVLHLAQVVVMAFNMFTNPYEVFVMV